jgi:hypothetical protein
VVDATPIKSAWVEAARAIGDGDLGRAAEIVAGIGHPAAAAYARLRAAEAFAAAGQQSEAARQRAEAESFYRNVGADGFLQHGEGPASAATRRASSQR